MPLNKTKMRVTLYLPDELRTRAADAGLNLSALLRRAVENELRGERPAPTVRLERTGASVEIRVSVPVDELRRQVGRSA